MEESSVSFGQLAASSKHCTRQLLTIGENRLELLALEIEEECKRHQQAVLLAAGMMAFGLLAALTLTAAIVIWLWVYSAVMVLLAFTVLYGAAGAFLWSRLNRLLQNWQTLVATMDQLRKDRACLEKILV